MDGTAFEVGLNQKNATHIPSTDDQTGSAGGHLPKHDSKRLAPLLRFMVDRIEGRTKYTSEFTIEPELVVPKIHIVAKETRI